MACLAELSNLKSFMHAGLVIGLSWYGSMALGNCESLVKGRVILDVKSCGTFNPEASFDTSKEKFRFINALPARQKKEFFDSYHGLVVKGTVVKSTAVRNGLVAEKNVLLGEQTSIFIPPGKGECSAILEKRIKIDLNEACCEGGGEAPCLLASALMTQAYEVLGAAASSAGDAKRQRLHQTKEYQEAELAFKKGDYKRAIGLYQKLRFDDKLDLRGHYQLGLAYRQQDQCAKAIPILNYVRDQSTKKTAWADEEQVARKAIMLLARCYAKIQDANMAVVILEGYLSDPKKYASEIKEGTSNSDFGWIRTTKDYIRFLDEAAKIH